MDPLDRRRLAGRLPKRHRDLRWIGLGVWLAMLALSALVADAVGPPKNLWPYIAAAGLASAGVIGLVAYARLASAPPELRTLRILAVLLPSLFIVSFEALLLIIEADKLFSEVGEHIFATAVLSLGTIPFSIWVFDTFSALRDQLTRHAERLEALHGASLGITTEPVTESLHDVIVRGALAVVAGDRAVLLVSDQAGTREMIAAAPPEPSPSERDLVILRAVQQSPARKVSTEAAPPEAGGSDETGALLTASFGGRATGARVLLVERLDGPAFTSEDALILDMYAVAAAAGIENAARLDHIQRLATVEERERIAHDLHDDLAQLLGFLTAKIQAAQELVVTGNSTQASTELAELEEASRALSAQVREAILGLRTSVEPDRPLGSALEEYTAEFGIQAELRTTFDGDSKAGELLPWPARYQALRIAQEALSNVRRHAHASRVAVNLSETDGIFEMLVSDDGIGFDPDTAAGSGRFGLKTMHERAMSLGGELVVSSAPGEGTSVRATIPLRGER